VVGGLGLTDRLRGGTETVFVGAATAGPAVVVPVEPVGGAVTVAGVG
jgi:hypothetical protein